MFEFNLETHIVLAAWLSKIDENLGKKYEQHVPELISDLQFWKNYFLAVHQLKAKLGVVPALASRDEESQKPLENPLTYPTEQEVEM